MDNTLEDLRTRIESGEGIASREEGCRRVAWFRFPDSHFPLAFPPIWR